MTAVMLAAVGLAAVNAALAAVLAFVYVRNHAEIRSSFTLGLVLFAAFLVVHDLTIVYTWWTMMDAGVGGEGMILLQGVLQTASLGALLSATMR